MCERCGSSTVLQVHHPTYIEGRKPWEYSVSHCQVLCRKCHAIEHGIILPRDGWQIVDSDFERNEPSDPVPCANCSRQVKWHVTIYHPDWGEAVVGSECGENLSLGPEFTKLKSYHNRLNAFIKSARWKSTPEGVRIVQKTYPILIFQQNGTFKIKIKNHVGDIHFSTCDEAKRRAFQFVEHRMTRSVKVENHDGHVDGKP